MLKTCRSGRHEYDTESSEYRRRCLECQRERKRIANMTPEQREREREREESRFRVHVGGLRWEYRVRPEKKGAIRQALDDYRAGQQLEYEEVADVRFHSSVA